MNKEYQIDSFKEAKLKAKEINGLVVKSFCSGFVVFNPYFLDSYKNCEPKFFHNKINADWGYPWYTSKGYAKKMLELLK